MLIEAAAYSSDIVAAGAFYFFLIKVGWQGRAISLLSSNAGSWSAFFCALLALAFGAWLMFFQLNADEFGTWLEWKGVGAIFSRVFAFHAVVFLLGAAVMLPTSIAHKGTLNALQLFIVLMATLSTITLGMLVYQLLRLQGIFRLELRKRVPAKT